VIFGVEQKVSIEDVERQPLAVVVLLQTGGAAPRQFQNYRSVDTMLDYMMGSSKHRVAVVTFDSQPEEIWDFTRNVDDLKDAFTSPGNGDGKAAIVDAVNYGIDLLKQQPASARRIILLFSQPQDDGSKAHAEDVVRRLGENNTTIYSITFSPEKTWLKDQFTKPRHGNPPYQLSPNLPPLLHTFDLGTPLGVALKAMREDTAAEVADLSGGEHVRFDDKRSLEQQLSILANHIPNRYTLSFRPSSNAPGLHAIKVQVVHQPVPLDIAARTSYWSSGPVLHP
jgi:VWFA-related protein